MIENKESSFIVKGFFVRTIFFTEQSLLRYFSELVCFNQNSASKSGNKVGHQINQQICFEWHF